MSLVRANFPRALEPARRRDFAWRVLIVLALVALFAAGWYIADVLLLAFAGVLLAIFLRFLAEKLASIVHIGRGWAFLTVAVGISLLLAAAGWEAAPRVADQISELIHSLPQTFERIQTYLLSQEWGQTVLNYLPNLLASANLTARISRIGTGIVDGLAGLVVIVAVGLYLGAHPEPYHSGLLKLFPGPHRERARSVFSEVAYALRWWVIGQLIPMAVLGVATGIGLYLLGIPLAFTLALFTGFMIFIPYIGSLIALAAALLVALTQGTSDLLYVTVLFIGIHCAEGYLVTPLVQRRAVYLPPGLTILAQVAMGLLLGFIGLALATPITAAALVVTKMLYLHETPQHHG